MSDPRVLTDAELDIVAGGLTRPPSPPTRLGPGAPTSPTGGNLLEEIIVDIVRLLEPKLLEPKIIGKQGGYA
jgi:hypothetical protein